MSNYALAAFAVLGVAAVVAVAPVAGLVIGASVASNAVLGGAVGLAVGAAALPVPAAYLMTREPSTDPADAGKSRLQRMGEAIWGIYSAVGGAIMALLPSRPVPNVIHKPDDGDDWHVEDFGPYAGLGNGKVERDFAASAPKGAGAPVATAAPAAGTRLKR
jgi:hypothetical protein